MVFIAMLAGGGALYFVKKMSGRGGRKRELAIRFAGIEKSDLEKRVDRNLIIAAGTLGASAAASLYTPVALLAVLGIAVLAAPIYQEAYRSLKRRKVKIEVVDSGAITIALVTGHFILCAGGALLYFCGKKLLLATEDRSTRKHLGALINEPQFAWVLLNGVEMEVPVGQVQRGDVILVRAGEAIPLDGRIFGGHAAIDERILTGES